MASNRRFTVEEALDTIFGDIDSEMEEEASGSESENEFRVKMSSNHFDLHFTLPDKSSSFNLFLN